MKYTIIGNGQIGAFTEPFYRNDSRTLSTRLTACYDGKELLDREGTRWGRRAMAFEWIWFSAVDSVLCGVVVFLCVKVVRLEKRVEKLEDLAGAIAGQTNPVGSRRCNRWLRVECCSMPN